MDIIINEKEYLLSEIETSQKNIFFCQIENRLLERGKLSAGQSKSLDIETAIIQNKNRIDYFEKRIEVIKDIYKEKFKEDIKLKFN